MEKKSNPRGRPRAYNPDKVIDAALLTFWRKGFSATSLDDLVEATGINRPSLYAGFGDKEQIYLLTLERCRERMTVKLHDALKLHGEGDTVAAALNRYLNEIIEIYLGDGKEAVGCAVLCTALSETNNHKAVREILMDTLLYVDGVFEDYFAKALKSGHLQSKLDSGTLTRLLLASQHSLAVRSRAGQSKKELQKVVTAFLRLVD